MKAQTATASSTLNLLPGCNRTPPWCEPTTPVIIKSGGGAGPLDDVQITVEKNQLSFLANGDDWTLATANRGGRIVQVEILGSPPIPISPNTQLVEVTFTYENGTLTFAEQQHQSGQFVMGIQSTASFQVTAGNEVDWTHSTSWVLEDLTKVVVTQGTSVLGQGSGSEVKIKYDLFS